MDIHLTRVTPSRYAFTRQDGDLTATLERRGGGTHLDPFYWAWTVTVCGEPIDSGADTFRDARASLIATLDAVAPAFSD